MSPRQRPVQARSRATVDRIVAAAAELLAEDGYNTLSTNAIARRAGVSPGTLYQYFGDRDEIVDELVHRMVRNFEDTMSPVLRNLDAKPNSDARNQFVYAVLGALEANAGVLRAIADRIPHREQVEQLAAIRARVVDAIHQLRAQTHPDESFARRSAVAWMILETAQHLAVRFTLDRPAELTREEFTEDLLAMIAALDG